MIKKVLILIGCVSMAGCIPHFKDADSYHTLFENHDVEQMPHNGDPYTFGGIAEGSGGTIARQSYATDNQPADFRDDTSTGKLGETDKDRTHTPGGIVGSGPILDLNGDGTVANPQGSRIAPAKPSNPHDIPLNGSVPPSARAGR